VNESVASGAQRNLLVRVLLMLLMAVAFHLAAWVLVCVAIVQIVFSIAADASNERLRGFGQALGQYLGQIAAFVSFGTEQLPFPFSDWPASQPVRHP
jgi:hypothetical protein